MRPSWLAITPPFSTLSPDATQPARPAPVPPPHLFRPAELPACPPLPPASCTSAAVHLRLSSTPPTKVVVTWEARDDVDHFTLEHPRTVRRAGLGHFPGLPDYHTDHPPREIHLCSIASPLELMPRAEHRASSVPPRAPFPRAICWVRAKRERPSSDVMTLLFGSLASLAPVLRQLAPSRASSFPPFLTSQSSPYDSSPIGPRASKDLDRDDFIDTIRRHTRVRGKTAGPFTFAPINALGYNHGDLFPRQPPRHPG